MRGFDSLQVLYIMDVMQIDLPQRFWDKVDKEAEPCQTWTGARNDSGYGVIGSMQDVTGKSHEYAHRLMFWAHGGTLEDGEVVDHSCGRGRLGCVDPDHLQACLFGENAAQGPLKFAKKICPKCEGPRVQRWKAGKKAGWVCKPCTADYMKEYNRP